MIPTCTCSLPTGLSVRRGRSCCCLRSRKGCSLQVRVEEGDAAGRSKLAAYMLRAPMSLEKMIYDADTGTVIYRSKMPASAAEATGGRGSWPRSRRR